MPKNASPELAAHIQLQATTLTTIWEITRRDGQVVRLTELDRNLTVAGQRFRSVFSYGRSAIGSREGLNVDSIDIEGVLNELITTDFISRLEVQAGLYDFADLRISAVNFLSPQDGIIPLKRGRFGRIAFVPSGRFQVELTSLTMLLQQQIIEKTSPTCRAQPGDARCMVPVRPLEIERNTSYEVGDYVKVATGVGFLSDRFANRIYECREAGTTSSSQSVFSTVVGDDTTDGSAVFRAHESFTRHGSVTSVTDNRVFTVNVDEPRAVDDWFELGVIIFESGGNPNVGVEIRSWSQSSSEITLFFPAPNPISVGDAFTIEPGDDRTRNTCRFRFAIPDSLNFSKGNVINFQGEPDLPGNDAVLTYPDAE